jgi:predicted metal-binding protein
MKPDFVFHVYSVIDFSIQKLCIYPYRGHPHGCPNYNKKIGCPPNAKLFHTVFNTNYSMYAIVNRFDLAAHMDKMKKLHPDWSDYQAACCLYWQAGARKNLSLKIKEFLKLYPDYKFTACPEAMGVNVTATMKEVGIALEWPPVRYTYQIALAGKLW